MALEKMNAYYNDNPDIKTVVDGTNSDCNTCIFAFEGLGGTTGVVNDLHPGGFLKAMMVVTKGKKIVYVTRNASTLPDKRPDTTPSYLATTTLKPGIYNYYVGNHGGYIALRQSEGSRPSWYTNPKDEQKFYTETAGGINIHATNNYPAESTGPFSAGCQTVYWSDYVDFGKAIGFLDFLDEDEKFESKLDPNSGLTSYMIDLVGSVTQHNSDKFPSTIKYILDREYDVNNGPSPEWGYGIFYPHNELGVLELETE